MNKSISILLKLSFLLLVFGSSYLKVSGQAKEIETPLQFNHTLSTLKSIPHNNSKFKKNTPVLQHLPFFDDFTSGTGWPNDTLWLDNYVYINSSFGILPPSLGVATFDGLNEHGIPYKPGNSSEGLPADTLTSTWIDLSSYSNKDSIYLSFFYQPQGLGDAPESTVDSLSLQFKPDSFLEAGKWNDTGWVDIWSAKGSSNRAFKQVLIPVLNRSGMNFFQNKFQFRFMATGNLSGNLDHWNLDYVYMKNGRRRTDTAYADVAIYSPSLGVLRRYTAMPWDQFAANRSNNMADSVFIYAANNDKATRNVNYSYRIIDLSNNAVLAKDSTTQSDNILPFQHRRFSMKALLNNPVNTNKVRALVQTSVYVNPDDHRNNDKGSFLQIFDNYLAYDDGTAEGGWGFVGVQNQAKGALRFTLSKPDSLYGFSIHFNRSLEDISNTYFTLAVWPAVAATGLPAANPVSTLNFIKPVYRDTLNGFWYFNLDTPRYFKDQFFIGWIQTSNFNMNVGLDQNYRYFNGGKANPNLYADLGSGWQTTTKAGVPMIRAFIGQANPHITAILPTQTQEIDASVFPNPSSGDFTLQLPDGQFNVQIFDVTGRLIEHYSNLNSSVHIQNPLMTKGVYLIEIQDSNGRRLCCRKLLMK